MGRTSNTKKVPPKPKAPAVPRSINTRYIQNHAEELATPTAPTDSATHDLQPTPISFSDLEDIDDELIGDPHNSEDDLHDESTPIAIQQLPSVLNGPPAKKHKTNNSTPTALARPQLPQSNSPIMQIFHVDFRNDLQALAVRYPHRSLVTFIVSPPISHYFRHSDLPPRLRGSMHTKLSSTSTVVLACGTNVFSNPRNEVSFNPLS